MRGSEVASESKKKIFKWTDTKTRGRGRYKSQGGIQQQEVVRIRNLIKWSTPLTRMANSSDTTNQRGKMERNYKDDGSSTQDETDWRSKKWNI